MSLFKHSLPSGIEIIGEKVNSSDVVSVEICMAMGSGKESAEMNGMTHFCEHMLFKGTPGKSWKELAREINLLGGQINASTGVETVKLHGTFIEKDFETGLRLLARMMFAPLFPADEVERERQVILEEIAMYEDTPEDYVYEKCSQALFLPNPLGQPILGPPENVENFAAQTLHNFWNDRVSTERIVISAAGNLDASSFKELAEELFLSLKKKSESNFVINHQPALEKRILAERDLEQINFCFGVTTPGKHSPERYALVLYDSILGGGMGSRLFDEIRERRGLAYSIGSSLSIYQEAGYLSISGSTRPEFAGQAIQICRDEIAKLAESGVSEDELETAKAQLERTILLSRERVSVRSAVNAEREIFGLEHLSVDDLLVRLRTVTCEDVQKIAQSVQSYKEPAYCVAGPISEAVNLEKSIA